MGYTFASATILLLLITDPLGNIPVFANALRNVPQERRARVILREVLIAFMLLLAFMFMGDRFLRVMGLSQLSLQIGGGVVLFLIALRMIFPHPEQADAESSVEPLIVPLAIPMLAGPSALATVLLLVAQAPERRLEWVAALSVTMAVCAVVLLLAERIQRVLGERVVTAFERLMGLVLVAVSVEMLIRGVKMLAAEMPH
ncbi:MarC family protein [Variovorax sp. HJSM1_2]|uniref:MarC family protein n=1 Tax=Variovorax sp. HJSM1_2 TaxID=3366263 RepID=UPI003BC03B4F